jgi:N-acetylmuramoyl-L-alanine amidase
MFSLNDSKTKLISDDLPINQSLVDANTKAGLKPKNLIFHCSGGPSLSSATSAYLSSANSVHLIVERNGREVAQMVDFDRVAFHANEFDESSLGIELVYPGYLIDKPGTYKSKERYDPLEMIFAQAENDVKKRWWPFMPQEQMDTLLEITRTLDQAFGLERIVAHDEINAFRLETGPAFPVNRLRQLVRGEEAVHDSLEEITSEAEIFLQPGGTGPKLLEHPLPAHTPIAITYDEGDWVLVEVMTALEERRWTVGWIEADKVATRPFVPVVNDQHLLMTNDNRQIKYLAPYEKNFNPNIQLEPLFVVIHFTTGTTIQSTINWFQSPASGVSAHLLVGRKGRVVQFVPFNQLAFHCGISTWEGMTNLNRFAIGIEVDNAGFLRTTEKGFMRRDKVIPNDQVRKKKHWKESVERPWQTFTDDQIQVVREIVQALKAKYPSIREILGHDMVNLINRTDPGPLYPLGELREAVLGGPQHTIKHYQITQACPIYANIDNKLPNPAHPVIGTLPVSTVRVKEVHNLWSLVVVKQNPEGKFINKEGWVLSKSIEPKNDKARTKFEQTFYQLIPASEARLPPLEIAQSPLPPGDHIRIQFEREGGWALVAPVLEVRKDLEGKYEMVIPEDKVKVRFLEGWVEKKFLNEVIS